MLDKTVEWLLEEDNAPVRFAALTSLLGRPMDDPEVTSARDAMMRTGTVPEILAQQNTDGSWGVPERFYLN